MPYQNYRRNYKKNYGSLNKKKWAPLMRDILLTNVTVPNESTSGSFATLVDNSTESAVPTPTILKCKHLKVSVDFAFDSTVLHNGFVCIVYVPQGITPTAGLPILHPEWVMAWRNIPNDVTRTHHNVMLQTSLTRNLNSGDKIYLQFTFYNSSATASNISFTGRYSAVVRNN